MGASIKTGGSGGGRRGRRQRHQPMGEINVTPFVDVMLVLLIIFMVTAPLMATGVPIDLPRTGAKQIEQTKKEPIIISIKKDGGVYLMTQETPTPIEQLKDKMAAIGEARGSTDDAVHINADETANYGVVVKVITQVMSAKFQKYILRTDPATGG